MTELTIVIPTFRRREPLRRALAALAAQSVDGKRFEAIVVDDPFEDDSAEVAACIAAAERPFAVRHMHRPTPGNVSAARNAGWRASSSPLVLFLGDDILAERDLVAEHLAWHRRHPEREVGVLGNVRWADELPKTAFMAWLDGGVQFDFERLQGTDAGWGMLYTSNASLKKSMLERVGGFDEERFPFLYEDTDLGYRLSRESFRLLYNEAARAQHLHAPRLDQWQRRMAETARAERRFVSLYPEREPYFERLLRPAAIASTPGGGLAAALLLRWPRWAPFRGRLAHRADLHFRRILAPPFFAEWDRSG
jgi:GT2 family glycosyltransferase